MPRLGYSKVRTGCLKCRQRKVKCDEKRPCSACLRHGLACSLVADTETLYRDGAPSRSRTAESVPSPLTSSNGAKDRRTTGSRADSEASGSPSVYNSPSPATGATLTTAPGVLPDVPAASPAAAVDDDDNQKRGWIIDMELMHHYCTAAHCTMPRADEVGHIWQVEAVNAALQSPYLLHLLLAFSAFHLVHLRPAHRARYAYAAAQHQNRGLAGMRSALTAGLVESSCHALFMAASLLAVGTFAALTVHAADPSDDRPGLDDVVEICVLLKGMNTVLSSWEPVIRQGPFRALFDESRPADAARLLPFWDDVADRLDRLRRPLADRIGTDTRTDTGTGTDQPASVASCIDREILRLRDLSRLCLEAPTDSELRYTSSDPELRFIMLWPIAASDAFVQLLRDRHPASLAVLAHYCVVVQAAAPRNWFTRGWAPKLLRAARSGMPAPYVEFLRWPLEHIRTDS